MEKSFPAEANLFTRYRKYENKRTEYIENQSRLRTIELQRANQGLNHDLDDSESSGKSETAANEGQTKYMTTNIMTPEKQPINEIVVDQLTAIQIQESIDKYIRVAASLPGKFKLFDPKETL